MAVGVDSKYMLKYYDLWHFHSTLKKYTRHYGFHGRGKIAITDRGGEGVRGPIFN